MIDYHALNVRMGLLGSTAPITGALSEEETYALIISPEYWIGGDVPTFARYQAEWNAYQLDEAKRAREAVIRATFDAAVAEGATVSQFQWRMRCDITDIDMLDKAVRLAARSGATDTQITDADGVLHVVSVADLDDAVTEIGGHYQTLWVRRESALGAIAAADTIEAVESVSL